MSRLSKTYDVAVIGGGISGIVSALKCARLGATAVLIEASQTLGGVLRDVATDEGKTYYSGCQYLSSRFPWKNLFDPGTDDLHEFSHAYGSWTEAGDRSRFVDGMAFPTFDWDVRSQSPAADCPAPSAADPVTLADHLERYGRWTPYLSAFAARSGHPTTKIHASCAVGMQMSAVHAHSADAGKLLALKASNPVFDKLFAARRSDRGFVPENSALPRSGYSSWMRRLEALLVAEGVEIILQAPARNVESNGSRLAVRLPTGDVLADTVVWAANPVPLLVRAGFGKLDNPFVLCTNVHCDVSRWTGPLPYYIQVFSANNPLARVYVYSIDGRVQACLECFGTLSAADLPSLVATTLRVVAQSPFQLALTPKSIQKLRRHTLFTPRDLEEIQRFNAAAPAMGIVPGGWEHFGRDAKIAAISEGLLSAFASNRKKTVHYENLGDRLQPLRAS